MFHIISDVNNPVILQQYIDNRDGNKCIGLKSFTYTLGWYNIETELIQKKGEEQFRVPPGYYSFQQISDIFHGLKITLSVNEVNGIVTMNANTEVKITKGLRSMLGFSKGRWFTPNKNHTSEKPLDFAVIKSLYVHLEQLNTSHNYFNGAPSTILAVIPVPNKAFGDVVATRFEQPEYKCLQNGTIGELKLEVRDENNNKIDNHGLPINAILEIK